LDRQTLLKRSRTLSTKDVDLPRLLVQEAGSSLDDTAEEIRRAHFEVQEVGSSLDVVVVGIRLVCRCWGRALAAVVEAYCDEPMERVVRHGRRSRIARGSAMKKRRSFRSVATLRRARR